MRMLTALLAASCFFNLQAQELVPNGNLEQFGTCPEALTQIDHASGWSRPTSGSTDYFNACQAAANTVGVPTNLMGYQSAHSGNGYAGIICFNGPENTTLQDVHEYLSHPLAAPLVPGETYAVSFFVSLADLSKYAVAGIGALLSVQQPHRDDMLAIGATPQVTSPQPTLLGDTAGWTEVHGCFTADSAYAWITIGNFRPGASTPFAQVPQAWSGSFFSYYYVDDVSVQHLPRPDLGIGPDLVICEATALTVQNPVPGTDYIWSTGETGTSITVDTTGTYSVQMANALCPLSASVAVQLGTPVSLNLPADTVVDFCNSPHLLLDARPLPPSSALIWSTGDTTASIVLNAAGTYTVHAQAPGSCPATATIAITDTCNAPLYAPNAFTPNGDGINDSWRPVWSANANATLVWSVYDRWGQVLFTTSAPGGAWDGTAAGTPVPTGAYVWRGHAEDPALRMVRDVAGHVVLMR